MAPQLQPDFSEEVTPPPPGVYRARIVGAEMKTAKMSGNPMINWKLELAGPNGTNFTSYHTTMLAGKGTGFLRRFMEAVNPNYNGEAIDTDKLNGKTLQVKMVDEINQQTGQKTGYLRVGDVSPDPDSSPFPESEIPF